MGNFEMPPSRLDDYDDPFDTTGAVSGGEAGPAGEIEGQMTWDDLATEFANTEAPKPAEMPASKLDDAEPAQVATSENEAMAGARALRALGMPPSTLGDDSPFDLSQVVELAGDRAEDGSQLDSPEVGSASETAERYVDAETKRKERRLREQVFEVAQWKYNRLGMFYGEMSENAIKSGAEYGRPVAQGIDDLYGIRKQEDLKRTETLLAMIDARFAVNGGDEENEPQWQDSKEEYLKQTKSKTLAVGEVLDGIKKELKRTYREPEDWLARGVDEYGEAQYATEQTLAEAYVAYIEDPAKSTRVKLKRELGNTIGETGSKLHRIMEILDKQDNPAMKNFVEVMNGARKAAWREDEEYCDAVMDYIKFKMEQAGMEEIDDMQRPSPLREGMLRVEGLL